MTTILIIAGCAVILLFFAYNMTNLPPYKKCKRKELVPKDRAGIFEMLCKVAADAECNVFLSHKFSDLAEPDGNFGCGEYHAKYKKIEGKKVDYVIVNRQGKVKLLLVLIPKKPSDAQKAEYDEFAAIVKSHSDYKLMFFSGENKDYEAIGKALK